MSDSIDRLGEIMEKVTREKTREDGTLCQRCGRRYRCDWIIPDEWWKMITYHNLLCGLCITSLIEFELSQAEMFKAFKVEEI